MKTFAAASSILLFSLPQLALAGTGPGPWADGAYYPSGLNGKYFGTVTGNNITGVVGFAIVEGAPPFRESQNQSSSGGNNPIAIINPTYDPDVLQNYFSIFVEGRVYSGITYAGIDIDSKKIAGTLSGINPPALSQFTVGGETGGTGPLPPGQGPGVIDSLPIVNRGLSGGFTAKIKKKKAVFTFKGDGQLSTPFNRQTVSVTSIPAVYDPADIPPSPAGTVTNQVSSAVVTTESTPFNITGIRTSFLSSNPKARQDELTFSSESGGGN